MSTQTTQGASLPTNALPGLVDTQPAELARAAEASWRARQAVLAEERRARVDTSAAQQQRIEDARRDQIAAEAFEEALDDGHL